LNSLFFWVPSTLLGRSSVGARVRLRNGATILHSSWPITLTAQGGGAPPFEPLYSAAERLPAGGAALINRLTNRLTNLTNRRYAQWAASMSDLPEPTATAEAAWRSSNPDPNP